MEQEDDKCKLLNEWKDALQKDIDTYQSLIDAQMEIKRKKEEKLSKQLQPILSKIATHQRRIDDVKSKIRGIDEELEKISNESDSQEI